MFRRPLIQRSSQPLSDRVIGDTIAAKMVTFLKERFLVRNDFPLPLDFVLSSVKEFDISDDLKKVLVNDILPLNPRINLVEGHVSYIPPLQISNEEDLKLLIEEKALRHEGVFEGDVMDSDACGATMLRSLQMQEESFITVQRMDDKRVIFGIIEDDLPKFNVDKEIKCMFQSVNTRHLDPIDIYKYLQHRNLKPMQAMGKIVIAPPRRRKRIVVKPSKMRNIRIRDNQHISESLNRFENDREVRKVKKKRGKKGNIVEEAEQSAAA